ncbi:Bax inhibitor-1/YccA family protein [Arenibaculum pallidiluteum]|uniref:Bax inhibitor-1/YccA family protein n=1 Tax=Arenibaculum pallidiluteum TaxID=2812559 RepID=UPI001A95D1F8|nr:Bax inhibitor-1/YccA family protein [Arenibaculum pallidiluteum]
MALWANRPAAAGARVDQDVFDAGLRAHMLRIYNYMAVGLGLTGLVSFLVANSPLGAAIFGSPLRWLAMLAPLGFVFFMSFKADSISFARLQGLFWAFCAVMGVSMASIFMVFAGADIARAFFSAASVFAAASLWGYSTRKSLDGIGSFMFVGLIGIVVASLINIFVGSTALQFAISIAAVVIFTGLTAWDTQRLKEQYAENYGYEAAGKLAVMGALSLYLNFINLFQSMLMLFGMSRDE